MTTARVEVEERGRSWIYTGAQVTSAVDLTRDREYASLDVERRLAKAVDQQRGWLDSLLGPGVAVDLRYIHEPGEKNLSCFILCRIGGFESEKVKKSADQVTARLFSPPSHFHVAELDEEMFRFATIPFRPVRNGRAEIRKRADSGKPNRPDAGVERYWACSPLRTSARSWTSLFSAIKTHQSPLLLSICLDQAPRNEHLGEELDLIATYYSKLAREGEWSAGGLYRQASRLSPDAFAQDAQLLFADMSRRYRGRVHLLRIGLASTAPLDEGLLEVISATISPPEVPHEGVALNGPLTTSTTEVYRVRDDEAEDFDNSLATYSARFGRADASTAEIFRPVETIQYLVDSREATAAFRLPIAESGVIAGFDVRSGEFNVASAGPRRSLQNSMNLGSQLVAGQPTGPFELDLDDLTMHAFVVGTTGSGKTSTCLGLLDRLWVEWGIPWMVIEPINAIGNDYRMFLERPGFESTVILTAGDELTAPLRLNLLEVPAGVTVGEHLSSLLGVFDAAFGLWDPLPAIYRRALEQTYFESGFSMTDRGGKATWPTLRDFSSEMHRVTNNLEYGGEVKSNIIAASRVRLEQLAAGSLRSVFDTNVSTPIGDLLLRPSIVELSRLGASNEQEIALVIAALMTRIAEERRVQEPVRSLRHVLLVEEAHKLVRVPSGGGGELRGDPSGAASRLFANLLAEIRKYGQGIIIADQDPSKLVPDAYKNTNLKIMHRLPAESDRGLVGGTMRFDSDHLDKAAALDRFTAFVYAEGYDRPGLVQFPNIREGSEAVLPTEEMIRLRYREFLKSTSSGIESLKPYRECEGCREICGHRSWAHSVASRNSVRTQFWKLGNDLTSANDRAEALGKMRSLIDVESSAQKGRSRCLAVHLVREAFDQDLQVLIDQLTN